MDSLLSAMNTLSKDHMEMTNNFQRIVNQLKITQDQRKQSADSLPRRRMIEKDSFRSQRNDYLEKQETNDYESQWCCQQHIQPCCRADQKRKRGNLNRRLNKLNRQLNDLNRLLHDQKRQPNNQKRQISQEKNAK